MRDIAFFISWTCYGQWIHGDSRGSVDLEHNEFGQPWLSSDSERFSGERERMTQEPYTMDAPRRRIVLQAIREVCAHRGWTLHALHVRALHVHVVVSGDHAPERMMNDFKSYASRALNAAGLENTDRKRWTRHGSTRHIDDEGYLAAAVNYVLNKQGEPMERWPEAPLPDGRGSSGALPDGRGSSGALPDGRGSTEEPRPSGSEGV